MKTGKNMYYCSVKYVSNECPIYVSIHALKKYTGLLFLDNLLKFGYICFFISQFINLGELSYNLAGFVNVKIYHCKYNSVMLSNFIK